MPLHWSVGIAQGTAIGNMASPDCADKLTVGSVELSLLAQETKIVSLLTI